MAPSTFRVIDGGVATTSYQASYEGFARRGLSAESTNALLQRSVDIAQSARRRVLRDQPGTVRELLVAASVGRVRWIGGCCRTTPDDIRSVRADVDAYRARLNDG